MAKDRSEKSKWPSRYSPKGWVTAAQFIIELICEKQAKRQKKDLPVKFWNLPEWQTEFVSQTRAANRLLKRYEPKAIIEAINSKGIWSLRPKWVEQIIQAEQYKLDKKREFELAQRQEVPKEEKISDLDTKIRKQQPSKFTKLLSMDDE